MKPNERVLNVDSTLAGEKVALSIDPNAVAHVMSILTDLYSDPELAIIREYSTNALDSHVEAGVTRPIEVQTPSAMSPYFKVKDYGVGLSSEDIREIYSRYGASTKRESDDVVGMLGLGCKSALTYTDQFTLTGIKDGIATVVSVSRDENGAGSMTLVDEYQTDEPSGVEITIPAKKYNELDEKAQHFFSFWKKGTVLLNGKEPEAVKGFRLTDDLIVTEGNSTSYVVMGNVPYPVPSSFQWADGLNWQYGRVAYVEIGDVYFTPSREALQMTPQTIATLEKIKKAFVQERDIAIQRLVDDAPSKPDALKLVGELGAAWGFRNNRVDVTYKGQSIPKEIAVPQHAEKNAAGVDVMVNDFKMVIANGRTGYGNNATEKRTTLPTSFFETSVWLTGFSSEDLSPYKKKKLIQWQEKQGFSVMPKNYILTPSVPTEALEWIRPESIKDWADVEAEKIVNPYKQSAGVSGKLVGSFVGWVDGNYSESIDINDIDTKKPVLYVQGTKAMVEELSARWNNTLAMIAATAPKGWTLLIVGKNRVEKLKRDMPKVQTAVDFIKIEAAKWLKKLTDDQKRVILYHDHAGFQRLSSLDETKIDDAELVELVKLSKTRTLDTVTNYNKFSRYGSVDFKGIEKTPKVIDQYPLLTQFSSYATLNADVKNHLYLYINAVHAAKEAV